MTDPDLSAILSLAGETGALIRLATMDDQDKIAMTERARTVKAALYVERLKDVVDPDHQLDDNERTRRATYLARARQAKAKLDAARRERNRRLLEQADRVISTDASAATAPAKGA